MAINHPRDDKLSKFRSEAEMFTEAQMIKPGSGLEGMSALRQLFAHSDDAIRPAAAIQLPYPVREVE
jgi:hypothetical protein